MTASGQQLLFIILVISAGTAVSVQAVINGSLGVQLNNPMLATTISFGVGFGVALCLFLFSGGFSQANLNLENISPILFAGPFVRYSGCLPGDH